MGPYLIASPPDAPIVRTESIGGRDEVLIAIESPAASWGLQ